MHMFVWDGTTSASLVVQPGNLTPPVGVAGFGPQSFATTTGAVVLADDGTAPDVNDACEAIANGGAVSGNVALVHRGTCSFKQKALNAQAAGAIAVVITDNQPDEPAPFLGDDPTLTTAVTIPVLSVSQADGQALEAALSGGLTAALTRAVTVDRDGTIDNTVIAHEWGHYLHLRHVACSSQQCGAESEGWADFDALMMVLRQGDALGGTFALAQYATASFPDDPAYFGIRRYPYTVDLEQEPAHLQVHQRRRVAPHRRAARHGQRDGPQLRGARRRRDLGEHALRGLRRHAPGHAGAEPALHVRRGAPQDERLHRRRHDDGAHRSDLHRAARRDPGGRGRRRPERFSRSSRRASPSAARARARCRPRATRWISPAWSRASPWRRTSRSRRSRSTTA